MGGETDSLSELVTLLDMVEERNGGRATETTQLHVIIRNIIYLTSKLLHSTQERERRIFCYPSVNEEGEEVLIQ